MSSTPWRWSGSDPFGVLGRIGYLSEERDLPNWMKLGELIRYNRAFYPSWDDEFAAELREMFELDAGQKMRNLSRGQRARAGLLIALAHRPDLLVLDEPSSGLDPVVRRDILGAIVRTVADEGRTILFSSHLLDEVQRVADRVAMIHQGRIILDQSVDEVLSSYLRVTVRLKKPQERQPDLPGAISWSSDGHEWSAVCNGAVEQLRQAAKESGAQIITEEAVFLEEVFVASVHNLS